MNPKSQKDFDSAISFLTSAPSTFFVWGIVLGMSSTVVTPPITAAREPVIQSSLYSIPGSRKWTWPSITPGST